MKIARENVRARQEEVKKPQKSDLKEGEVNKRLKEMLDPMTQKLFSMLPPPKEAGGEFSYEECRHKSTSDRYQGDSILP